MKAHNLFILLFTCTLLTACTCGNDKEEASTPVKIPASIFHNRDSVMYYAALAYKDDDPKGQFVVGACYYLRQQGELPDTIYAVGREEADEFLMLSAQQGYQPALDLIHCLQENGEWKH